MDAENFTPDDNKYALIAGNFVAQWFKDPALTLGRFAQVLEPGGLLLMAFPGSDSFPEWRQRCHELGLPFTGNTLPDTEEMVIKLSMGPAQVDFYEDSYTAEFPDALSFFQHLKGIGATKKLHDKQLNAKQFRLLINHWDQSVTGSIKVTWHLVFLALKKDL
jgi:malonyl-CoA O-methyltransferase